MLVVEGADNSGKSTLAKFVGLAHFSAGPAPENALELRRCLEQQRSRAYIACIQDRLTCISQQVYSEAPESWLLQDELLRLIDVPRVVIVYCRPPERTLMDLSTHKAKSYDTEANMSKIAQNQHTYIKRYDDLMHTIPHIMYDWTEHDDETNRQIRSLLVESQLSDEKWRELLKSMKTPRFG